MRIHKKTPYGQFYEEYLYHDDYLKLSKKRSLGIEPEMEAAKATANLIKKSKLKFDSILDVGCQSGHYLFSLRKKFGNNFRYIGIDGFSNHINCAKKVWKRDKNAKFIRLWIQNINRKDCISDISISINLFTHLPEINRALRQLNKNTRKLCIIRTPIHNISYKIQQVYNKKWYKHSTIAPEEEFDVKGNPKSFNLFNVYSKDYFKSAIKKNFGRCKIIFIKDNFFKTKNINRKEKKYLPTRVVNDLQVSDIMIVPNYFVLIYKNF